MPAFLVTLTGSPGLGEGLSYTAAMRLAEQRTGDTVGRWIADFDVSYVRHRTYHCLGSLRALFEEYQ